jgi:uncharacterized protein YicC (UPF0701 family)
VRLADILHLPHVVYWQEKETLNDHVLLPAVRQALQKLVEFKEKEGRAIKKQIIANLKKLKSNANKIKVVKPKAYSGVENNKEDIDEEVSLLRFYIKRLENKVNAKGNQPIGKSIDFLTQEILRELNAASSKTKQKKCAALIVESKNYLERIREQAQNIE